MDEYPDEHADGDVSLGNLHYGLDSSIDEAASGSEKKGASPGTGQRESVVAENQMSVLQDMVLEMKEGFQTALEELVKIQVKEEAEANHSKKLQEQQQVQLAHLTETISEIKNQLSSLTKSVEQIKDEQALLKNSLEEVRSNRNNSQGNRFLGDRSNGPDDFSSHSEEYNSKFSELPAQAVDHNLMSRNDEIATAAACKSLSLTLALAEVCQSFNLSHSSDEEEGEDQGPMRLSNYRENLISDQLLDRQPNMSVYAGLQDRSKLASTTVQRQRAVTQLADSERDYCFRLWSLCYTYLTSIQTAGLLSTRDIDILIPPYLDKLYREHCGFCTKLQDRLMHWTLVSPVADLLSRVIDSYNSDSLLSLYQKYANDLPEALSFLRRALAQSSEFRMILKQIQHSGCHGQDLMSLLLSPIQRMPNYLLQVQEICCQTPPSHADFPHLQALLHQLQNFVDQLNDVLLYTMDDLNHDGHTGSGYLNGHFMSARDSGVHSTSTEDDYIVSARSFHKTNSQMPSEWIEAPYHVAHQRQAWAPSGRVSSLSHSDLTVYNKPNNGTSDMFSHIPRSQSNLHAADDSGRGGNQSAARQRVQKFKIKMRSPSPARYPTKNHDYNHSNGSPKIRPVSSVDFLRHHNQQLNHNQDSDLPEQSRNYQHPVAQPRSHSALGLHTMSTSHRPVVISRKNLKRPQSSVSTSDAFWDNSISSATLPAYGDRHLTANNFQPTISQTTNIRNDNRDDDDDTRASDTNSIDTRGSHPYNDGQDFNGEHNLELNLVQRHVDRQNSENIVSDCDSANSSEFISPNVSQNLSNGQMATTREYTAPVRQVISRVSNSTTAKLKEQLSKPTANQMKDKLPRPLSKENQPLRTTINQMKENQPSVSLTNQIEENHQSRPLTNQIRDNHQSRHPVNQMKNNVIMRELSLTLNDSKEIKKYVKGSALDPKPDSKKGLAVLPNKSSFIKDSSVPPVTLAEPNLLQDGSENSKNVQGRSERNNVVRGRDESRSVVQDRDENSCVQERNETSRLAQRKYEMSMFAQRGNVVNKPGKGRNESSSILHGKSEDNGLVQEISESLAQERNENNRKEERIESNFVQEKGESSILVQTVTDSEESVRNGDNRVKLEMQSQASENNRQFLLSLARKESDNAEHDSSSKSGKSGSSLASQAPVTEAPLASQAPAPGSPLGIANTKPALPPKRHLQSPVSPTPGSTYSAKTSTDGARPLSSFKYEPQGMPSSNQMYQRPPSVLSNDAANLNKNNHKSTAKLPPHFTSSASGTSDAPIRISQTTTTFSGADIANGYNDKNEHDLRPLSMADLQSDDGKRERRKEISQKEIKDGGNVTSVDGLQSNEDHASIKKKSHFRASLKHLFAKKKGRVILADVEREVLKEMSTAAVAATISPTNKADELMNVRSSRNAIMGDLRGYSFHSCAPSTDSTFKVKDRKDQASSTSSPVKANRKFIFCTNHDSCTGLNCPECEKLRHKQNTVEYGKMHILHYDRIPEMADKEIAKEQNGSVDSGCSMEPVSCRDIHSKTPENNNQTEPHLILQSLEKSPSSCQSLAGQTHCHKSVTMLPQYQPSLIKTPYSGPTLIRTPSSGPSLIKTPSSGSSFTKTPSPQQSCSTLAFSHQENTKTPFSHQENTKKSWFQNKSIQSPCYPQNVINPQSCLQKNITKPLCSQQSLSESQPLLQEPQNKITKTSLANTAIKFHNITHLNSKLLSRQIHSPNNPDCLKSASNVCDKGHQVCVHNKDKTDNSSFSECGVIPPCRPQCQPHKELHLEKSQSGSHDVRQDHVTSSQKTKNYTQSLKLFIDNAKYRFKNNIGNSNNSLKTNRGNSNESLKINCGNSNESLKFNCGNSNESLKLNCGNSNESLKVNCGNSNESLKLNCGNSNESLKVNCGNSNGSLKLNCGNSNESLKVNCGNSNESLKVNCGNSNGSLKVNCGNSNGSLKVNCGNSNGSLKVNCSNSHNGKPYINNSTDSLSNFICCCKTSHKSYTDNSTHNRETVNGNSTGKLRPSDDDKYIYNTSERQTLVEKQALLYQKRMKVRIERSVRGVVSLPDCQLHDSPTNINHQSPKGRNDHSFPVCTTSSSDKNRLSENVGCLENLTETASVRHGGNNKTVLSYHMSHQKIVAPAILNHRSSDKRQVSVPSRLKSEIAVESTAEKQLLLSREINTCQSDIDKESAEPGDTTSDLLVKCFSLEDKDSFQHRYRLYFDEESFGQDLERA